MRIPSVRFFLVLAAGCGTSASGAGGGPGGSDASLHSDAAGGQESGTGSDGSSGSDGSGNTDGSGNSDGGSGDGGSGDGGSGDGGLGGDACANAVYGQACMQDSDCTCGGSCAANKCIAPFPCTDALLTWNGPTENEDGTCLTDLAGFDIDYGQDAQAPDQVTIDAGLPCAPGKTLACGDAGKTAVQLNCARLLTGFADASTWYFEVFAYTDAGVTSPASGEASYTFTCP